MINIHTHYSCHLTYGNTLNRRFILCLYSWVVWLPVASEMYHLHCRLTSVDSMSLCKTPSMCATSTDSVQWCNGRGALHWLTMGSQHAHILQDMDFIGFPSCSEHAGRNTHTRTHTLMPSLLDERCQLLGTSRMAKKNLRLACSKRIPYLAICSCQGPRLVHLEFLTNFETNCQWSIAERSKNNAKQKHKCHVYIRLHHLAISLGAKRKVWNGLNMLEITEDYMKLKWSDMKQPEITFHPPKKQAPLGCPL